MVSSRPQVGVCRYFPDTRIHPNPLLIFLCLLNLKFVRHALQEQRPEDKFLVLGRVHFPGQVVRGFEEMVFKLREIE